MSILVLQGTGPTDAAEERYDIEAQANLASYLKRRRAENPQQRTEAAMRLISLLADVLEAREASAAESVPGNTDVGGVLNQPPSIDDGP